MSSSQPVCICPCRSRRTSAHRPSPSWSPFTITPIVDIMQEIPVTIDVLPTELQPALLVSIGTTCHPWEPASLVSTVFSAVPPTTILRHPAFLAEVSVKVVVMLGLLDVPICIRVTQRGRGTLWSRNHCGEHVDSPLWDGPEPYARHRAAVRCAPASMVVSTDTPAALSARWSSRARRQLVHTGAVPRSIPVVNKLSKSEPSISTL